MRRIAVIAAVVVVVFGYGASLAWAETIQVPVDYGTIQDAINAAADGDTIEVYAGTYTGTGNVNLDFGGKNITLKSVGGVANCIIDCEGSGRGFYFHSGETSEAVVDGFTITSGNGNNYMGGGMYFTSGTPTIKNCILTGNSTNYGGGAVAIMGTASPKFINCLIVSNNAYSFGGGVYCYATGATPTFTNCTIADNHGSFGGGIFNAYANPTLNNCIIRGNTDNINIAREIRNQSGTFTLNNCCYADGWGNVYGTVIANNCTTDDPLFLDAGEGDYHLKSESPCIDTGDNSLVPEDVTTDVERNPRIVDGDRIEIAIVDMGCYEYAALAHFDCTPISGDAPLEVQFFDQSLGEVTSWSWDFDDDGTVDSTVQNPTHIYSDSGTYTVSLTVEGPLGERAETREDLINVTVSFPVPDFSAAPTDGSAPLDVQFTDESTGNVSSWKWDFNEDGTTDSEQQNPLYTYTRPGVYTVRLTVTGPDGWDMARKIDYVTVYGAIYVSTNKGDDSNDGSSQETSVRTLKKALQLAQDGYWVLVADGYYVGEDNSNLDFEGKQVHLKSMHGPSNCAITARGHAFHFHSGETQDSIVEGFAILRGYATESGAIRCENNSNPMIINCILTNNRADYGGAVWCSNSSPSIVGCIIAANKAKYHGGAVFCENGSNPTFTNCTIDSNTSETSGGGIYCTGDSHPTLNNLILWDNTAADGYQLYIEDVESHVTLAHCDYEGDSLDEKNVEGAGTLDDSDDCIMLDPQYVSASPRNYHMWKTSPCMNAGDGAFVPPEVTTDPDGNARKVDVEVDIGAYEGGGLLVTSNPGIIQSMVDQATNGETVWIEEGTYDGPVFIVNKSITIEAWIEDGKDWLVERHKFIIKAHDSDFPAFIFQYGGTCTVRNLTFDNRVNGVYQHGGGIACIGKEVFENNELKLKSPTVLIENCTISGNWNAWGGGIYCFMSNPTIKNCSIRNNKARRTHAYGAVFGGGIMLDASSPTISNCLIQGNVAENPGSYPTFGGGICCLNRSRPIISDCTINGNKVGFGDGYMGHGGGIYSSMSGPKIIRCNISDNEASKSGGGVEFAHGYMQPNPEIKTCRIMNNSVISFSPIGLGGGIACLYNSIPKIVNCEIVGNSIEVVPGPSNPLPYPGGGGGIGALVQCYPIIVNCTIAGNRVDNNGGGLFLESGSTAEMINDIVWDNSANANGNQIYVPDPQSSAILDHCDYADNTFDPNNIVGNGTISEYDCIYIDPEFYGLGYKLEAFSPCKNAGLTSILWLFDLETDVYKSNDRISGPAVDIGSYEIPGEPTYRAVIVGVSQYGYMVDLESPARDAGEFYQRLLRQGPWSSKNITLMTSDSSSDLLPVHGNIYKKIEDMTIAANDGDTLLFYFVGHGDLDDEINPTQHCIIPSNGESWKTGPGTVCPDKNISEFELRGWLSGAPSTAKILVMIDSCYSGGMDAVNEVAELVTSANEKETAREAPIPEDDDIYHAAFTYYLNQKLQEQATDADSNGFVSGEEAHAVVEVMLGSNPNQNPQRPNPPYTVDFIIAGTK